MRGHTFVDDEDIMCTVNGWLEDQEQQFLYNGVRALERPSAFQLQETVLKSDVKYDVCTS